MNNEERFFTRLWERVQSKSGMHSAYEVAHEAGLPYDRESVDPIVRNLERQKLITTQNSGGFGYRVTIPPQVEAQLRQS
ncbi:MAG: hypothetical protein QM737_02880 [Ferruginibacter sp.]